jgi:subtilisin
MIASLYPAKTHKSKFVASAEKEAGKDDRFTGREIVLLNQSTKSTTVENKANTALLRLANISDYKSASSPLAAVTRALSEADGVVFDRLKIAVFNSSTTEQVHSLRTAQSTSRIFLDSEPERYVYALAKKQVARFDDDQLATWGVHATNTLQSTYTGKGVKIAILDTGMNLAHRDFKGRKIISKTFVNQSVEDGDGHGTNCIGVAAGNISTGKGFRYGIAPEADIYVAKVLKNNREGEDNFILAGIEWALENKCRVISMSFGSSIKRGETYYESYETVARRALRLGTLIIAAAGNDSKRRRGIIKSVNHPANCPSIMSVGAVDKYFQVADFSCAGSRAKGNQVNIAAPGVGIFSSSKKNGYEISSGTSMATPYIAGLAALLWQKYPTASAKTIWKKLIGLGQLNRLKRTDVGAGIAILP